MHSAKFISITPDAEKQIAYCARVSSPHQESEETVKLLNYCMKHGHWSVFELASMTVEITTTRAISPQILRHRSFSFQEFSARYSSIETSDRINPLPSLISSAQNIELRAQDKKNRQNSFEVDQYSYQDLLDRGEKLAELQLALYQDCIDRGVALECARNYLPMHSPTRLYMSGTIRSFLHYCKVRCEKATQKEHRMIANSILDILCDQLPSIKESILEYVKA